VFGNGVNGRRPPARSEIRHDGFVRTEGATGNVGAGSTWRVPALGRQVEVFGRNPAALAGGADRWSLDELVAAARTTATEREVLLTDDDLVTATFGLPGFAVGRAEVVNGFDPALPDRQLDGVRTLVVIPHRQPEVEFDGVSDMYVGMIRAALDEHRVLGERLIVAGPRIVLVDVELRATIQPGAVAETVRQAIVTALRNRLSDVRRADDMSPWPLGRPVTVQELTTIVANVEGVVTVPICRIARNGEALGVRPIEIDRDAVAIAVAPRVTIDAAGGTER
jgi:predicted phage baseplate assembly protein